MQQEKKKRMLLLYGSMFLAILLGVYAQEIAYFLYRKIGVPLLMGLSMSTIFSILFFFSPSIIVSMVYKGRKVEKKEYNRYLVINTIIAIIISFFSIMVFIAWWG